MEYQLAVLFNLTNHTRLSCLKHLFGTMIRLVVLLRWKGSQGDSY